MELRKNWCISGKWRSTLNINDECDIFNKEGICHRGVITERVADKIKIHYLNWSDQYDEWLNISNKRISPSNTYLIPFINIGLKGISHTVPHFHCFNDVTKQHYLTVANGGYIYYYNMVTGRIRGHLYPQELQGRLNECYPLFDNKTNTFWFIDIKRYNIFKWDTKHNQYICDTNQSFPCFHAFDNKYRRKNFHSFTVDNELHIVYGDSKQKTNIIQHIKYNENENIFIQMDNIESKKKIKFNRKNIIYNWYQKRLYMVSLTNGNKENMCNVCILYIDDINQWNNKWRVNNVRKWNTFNTTIKIEDNNNNKFNLNKWRCVIVYDTILMIVINNMILWIDLKDFSLYQSDKYLHRREKAIHKYLLNTYDHYVHILDFSATNWYKVYLPNIIPKQLYLKYSNRMSIVVNGYIKKFVNKHKIYSKFPECLTQLISLHFLAFFC